ncbi:MAG: hypothetical protein RBG13Loki_4355 [Promethearchaeota archaeon CR_4]|nr:MAG: hypothetical protein RBG13Loki_4355 [Candidatus Lokiarchaeota archaeon CR_4]
MQILAQAMPTTSLFFLHPLYVSAAYNPTPFVIILVSLGIIIALIIDYLITRFHPDNRT